MTLSCSVKISENNFLFRQRVRSLGLIGTKWLCADSMSTLSGIVSKGEKGKSKFQSLDINSLYRVSRVSWSILLLSLISSFQNTSVYNILYLKSLDNCTRL